MTGVLQRDRLQGRGRRSAKVVLLGEPGVGKTSIFRRLKDGTFCEETTVTVGGGDQYDWEYRDGETAVTLRISDTAGREKKFGLGTSYFHEATAVVLVYAVNRAGTLEYLSDWIDVARRSAPANASYFVVGNKIDLRSNVEAERIGELVQMINTDREYLKEEGMFRMSCKTGDGVRNAFETIAREINANPWPPPPEPVIVPHEERSKTGQRKCCKTA